MPDEIRVVVADEHVMVREGLCALLSAEDDISVVGTAGSGEETLACARSVRPDVLVLDLAIPSPGGVEVTRRLATAAPDVRVLLITCSEGDEFVVPALTEGAAGIVRKTSPEAELARAVRAVAADGVHIPPHETGLLAEAYRKKGTEEDPAAGHVLSPRERQVLAFTVRGYTAREIARELELSPKTVEGYLAKVREKLDARHRSDLFSFALEAGIVGEPSRHRAEQAQ